ncbi:group II truncated hemoglobin [Paucibacter sp. Y2R2-4]|uniref:group II truncated hemoglobin n=1 Tax=Paucibacter sp. Y2R2-4 TaxID=2893553 RepID=UPI0021E36A11|nr:group II truncated hemoglobin [Paucibacter sp. Y2R2-4]MCV2351980.1 group II truncated hemoglobin [Paucibacter sp. Y2R2-4]
MQDTQANTQEPATTLFELLGGEPGIRELVDQFYDRMELEPHYALLRSLHPSTLEESRNKLHWFLCGWSGGPDLYIERFGHPRLRARHLPYSIGIAERDQWMACMIEAMQACALPEPLQQRLAESFYGTADWMRNRGG